MKEDVHPEYQPVIFKDGEHEIVTRSTATSEQTREVDGVEHHVIRVDVSGHTHPFYTGEEQLVDTEGRVDRFRQRYDIDGSDDEADEPADADDTDEPAEADESDETDDEEPS